MDAYGGQTAQIFRADIGEALNRVILDIQGFHPRD
jgi:hypothetical protein